MMFENKAHDNFTQDDPELEKALALETERQSQKLEMIASENYTSGAVMRMCGSILTNKYAEGYPGKRYYGGCEHVDTIEDLARDRAKSLFGAAYANVQPHSGTQANMGVYFAALKPGDTILGMDLAQGGHLSHGATVSFSGKLYRIVRYGVDRETERIDFAALARIAEQEKPRLIVAGASAYSRTIDFEHFRKIANDTGALLMVDMAHIAGLVAAKLHPSPVMLADFTTATTHKTLRGPRSGMILIGKPKENDLGLTAPKSDRLRTWAELVDSSVMPGIQGGPLMHIIAAKAVAFREAASPAFVSYIQHVLDNAKILAQALTRGGARIVSGGTDNHLMLVDLTSFGITGKDTEIWLDAAHITVNKNGIPFDPLSPMVTSGIRLGTAALTTRGMGTAEMETIAELIMEVIRAKGSDETARKVREKVKVLCDSFPIPGNCC